MTIHLLKIASDVCFHLVFEKNTSISKLGSVESDPCFNQIKYDF